MGFIKEIGAALVNYYSIYSDMIHSVFPTALGDLVEYLLDIVIVIAIIKVVASFAFGTKANNG